MTSYVDGKFTILDTLGPSINQQEKTVQCQVANIDGVDFYSFARIEGGAEDSIYGWQKVLMEWN